MKVYKAGIIGCGQIAGGYNTSCDKGWSLTHACSYKLIDNVELVSACDPSNDVRISFGEKWGVNQLYSTVGEMLENENLDIISICSPTENHMEAFEVISKYNNIKAVFCEKPLSYDLNESYRIANLAGNKYVSLNYFRRWNNTFKQLSQDISDKKYGDVIYISVRYTKGLLNNGSHFIDLLYWFFGEPVKVKKYHTYVSKNSDAGVDFKLTFPNNIEAAFSHIPNVPYVFIEVDILTATGKISIKQRGQTIEWSESTKEPYYNTFNMLKSGTTEHTDWQDCPTKALSELVGSLETGKRNISCTIEDGLIVGKICKQILDNTGNEERIIY